MCFFTSIFGRNTCNIMYSQIIFLFQIWLSIHGLFCNNACLWPAWICFLCVTWFLCTFVIQSLHWLFPCRTFSCILCYSNITLCSDLFKWFSFFCCNMVLDYHSVINPWLSPFRWRHARSSRWQRDRGWRKRKIASNRRSANTRTSSSMRQRGWGCAALPQRYNCLWLLL